MGNSVKRQPLLREMLKNRDYIRAIGVANGLMGLVAENAIADGRGYDALWISSLCDSATRGKPDNEIVDFSQRLNSVIEIMDVTTKPIIYDADTGGSTEHFVSRVKSLERIGVSAVVIEDKKGVKRNSLLGDSVLQILEDKDVFAQKLQAAKSAQTTQDFCIFARIESFIAGKDLADAIDRARKYVTAGADGIVIHSCKEDGEEIRSFLKLFRQEYPDIITIVIPTAYSSYTEDELNEMGADIIIYANHLLRSAYKIMKEAANMILNDKCCDGADKLLCAPVKDILMEIGDDND